jgi:hypothetical protein
MKKHNEGGYKNVELEGEEVDEEEEETEVFGFVVISFPRI